MMRPQESALFLLFALTLSSCGGNNSGSGGSTTTPPPSNPVPTVTTISPNSSQQGGPAFTLSVVGANFLATSQVQWNGTTMPTTFVSSALITADVPATAVSTAGATVVAVTNPSPGGGTSNTMDFAVPCTIPWPAPTISEGTTYGDALATMLQGP